MKYFVYEIGLGASLTKSLPLCGGGTAFCRKSWAGHSFAIDLSGTRNSNAESMLQERACTGIVGLIYCLSPRKLFASSGRNEVRTSTSTELFHATANINDV